MAVPRSAPRGQGLCRSKTVVDRLDAHFKGAALFHRAPGVPDELDRPMDEVLWRLAAGKLRPGRGAMLRRCLRSLAKDPRLHAIALSAGSGSAFLGTLGGSCGLALGAIAGAAAGTVPAPLTFGLSIPAGAIAGSAIGACTGVVAGSGIGFVGAGVAGGVAYQYRVELLNGAVRVRARVAGEQACPGSRVMETVLYGKTRAGDVMATAAQVLGLAVARALETSRWAISNAQCSAEAAAEAVVHKATAFSADLLEVVSDRQVQVTATAATGGAIVLGTGGGTVGLLTGSALGAVFGLIPALLTFGLSVPVFATVCGGTGLCAGAAIGGAAGLVGGAAAGYSLSEEGLVEHLLRGKVGGQGPDSCCVGGTGGTA